MDKRAELLKRFDDIMAGMKPIEPSEHFDFEFRQALKAAMTEAARETSFARLARRVSESLRYTLAPASPVLVRTFAVFAAFIIIGSVIYSTSPVGPVVTSSKGIVLACAEGAKPSAIIIKTVLKAGDVITTEDGAEADISVDNKYAVRLKSGTRLKVARLTNRLGRGKAVFDLEGGKVLVSIEKGFKPASFMVNTKDASATALGTKFAVDISGSKEQVTKVSVLEGRVRVLGQREEKTMTFAKGVTVGLGQETEIGPGGIPQVPKRLSEEEWLSLEELYQIGRKPHVILCVKYTPDRVMQLLKPCPLYVSDEKPRQVPRLMEEAVLKVEEAVRADSAINHLEAINVLERILKEYPNQKYDVQLLLYVGAYYEYIGRHNDAIRSFEDVIKRYPDSPLASLAMAAIGVIYEDKLNDPVRGEEIFRTILKLYPNSLEAIWVDDKFIAQKA